MLSLNEIAVTIAALISGDRFLPIQIPKPAKALDHHCAIVYCRSPTR
jgi:hypothetical protein